MIEIIGLFSSAQKHTEISQNKQFVILPEVNCFIVYKNYYENVLKYQPSGAGGPRSPPATPHRLQHLSAQFIQNGRQGLEICQNTLLIPDLKCLVSLETNQDITVDRTDHRVVQRSMLLGH